MLMQGSINVEFSVSSTAILLAWYSVIQTYFMVGNSLQLCWQKDTTFSVAVKNCYPGFTTPLTFYNCLYLLNCSRPEIAEKETWFSDNITRKSDKKNGNNENEPSFLRLVHIYHIFLCSFPIFC
jgi:hypothetical protein